jgi:hypothetical protein
MTFSIHDPGASTATRGTQRNSCTIAREPRAEREGRRDRAGQDAAVGAAGRGAPLRAEEGCRHEPAG